MRDGMGLARVSCVEALEGRRLMSVGVVQRAHAVRMETSVGRMTVELMPEVTPITVQNFLRNYVYRRQYDNTLVHRSVPGFVIQGGGYRATGKYPHIPEMEPVRNEFVSDRFAAGGGDVNVRGTMAMAERGDDPNSATSEWFINLADNAHVNDAAGVAGLDVLNGGFTVFGRVIGGGMHTADAIAGLQVENGTRLNSAFTDLPVMSTAAGTQLVVVKSVRAEDEVGVGLDRKTKKVVWVDEHGASATITLSHGTADLKFVGEHLVRRQEGGGVVTVEGKGVELVGVATHGTSRKSVLSVTSRGGTGPARVGDISTDGALGRIDAGTAWLEGDVNAAGAVGRIDVAVANRSVITAEGSGSMVLNVGRAVDLRVDTTMRVGSMAVGTWESDGMIGPSVRARGIGRMEVKEGVFDATVNVDWGVRSVEAGRMEGASITAGGKVGALRAAEMSDTQVSAGRIASVALTGRGVTFSGSTISAVGIGTLELGEVDTSSAGRVIVREGISELDAVVGTGVVSVRNVKGAAKLERYFAARKIRPGDFGVTFV